MKKLNFVDKGFLIAETRETPMHVAGVSLYTLPEGADEQEFLRETADGLRNFDKLLPPFGDRIKTGLLGMAGNVYWEPDPALDIEYHIRHSALPEPGRYRELFNLASRLHTTLLDRSRPLWETHLIEGLQKRQFAMYTKTHHAAIDGARSVHLSRSMLSADPTSRMLESPMSMNSWERYRATLPTARENGLGDSNLRTVSEALKAVYDTSGNLYGALKRFTNAWRGEGGALMLPFMQVPTSHINTSVGSARRFVAQSWPFARIHAIGKAYDGTFNDAVLAMCAGALRTYLQRHGVMPDDSLKAMVPVSLRQAGDVDSTNAVASISADLATNISDPAKRIQAIKASTKAGKDFYSGMSAEEVTLFSMLIQSPAMLLMPLGLASKMPPFNTVISNVPGIRQKMYWNGARMEGSYPMSIITDGIALNITLVTYDRNVDFGIIACRRSMPQVQRLIDYMEDALVELEVAAGIPTGGPAGTAKEKAPRSTAKARTKSAAAKKKPVARKKAAPKKKPAAKKAPAAKKKTAPKKKK